MKAYSIYGMRKAFALFSPTYAEAKEKRKVRMTRYGVRGQALKVPLVAYQCEECEEIHRKVEVDHIIPVVPFDKTQKEMSFGEIYERLNCSVDNLRVLCKPCHQEKTNEDRRKRKSAKEKTEETDT